MEINHNYITSKSIKFDYIEAYHYRYSKQIVFYGAMKEWGDKPDYPFGLVGRWRIKWKDNN